MSLIQNNFKIIFRCFEHLIHRRGENHIAKDSPDIVDGAYTGSYAVVSE
jgi:hypothetical protein